MLAVLPGYPMRCAPEPSGTRSAFDAGVGAVEAAFELDADDVEAGDRQHRLEQPAVGAELGSDVLGVVRGGVPLRRVGGGAGEPAREDLARLAGLEVVDQVA